LVKTCRQVMYIILMRFSWGGCVVVMVPSDDAERFVKSVRDQYYSNRKTCGKRIDELVFATSPSEGACCVHVKTISISDGITDQLPALVHLWNTFKQFILHIVHMVSNQIGYFYRGKKNIHFYGLLNVGLIVIYYNVYKYMNIVILLLFL